MPFVFFINLSRPVRSSVCMLRLAVAISAVEGPPAKVRLTKQKYKWGKLLYFSSSPPDELNIEEHPYFIVEK